MAGKGVFWHTPPKSPPGYQIRLVERRPAGESGTGVIRAFPRGRGTGRSDKRQTAGPGREPDNLGVVVTAVEACWSIAL